jgi:hypothetical protein
VRIRLEERAASSSDTLSKGGGFLMVNKTLAFASLGAIALIVLACGSSSSGDDGSSSGDGSSGGTSGSLGGTSGSSGTSGSLGSSGSSGQTSGDLGGCGAETKSAQQLPLDILVMLDTSGSMTEATTGGGTKWDAVKSALASFVNDPKSAGIGVGLQTFPIKDPSAPATCTASSQCQVGGKNLGHCSINACRPAKNTDPITYCDTGADCPGTGVCEPFGQCASGPITDGTLCLKGDPTYGNCPIPGFKCTQFTSGECDADACVAADYATPKVAVAALPANAGSFTTTLNGLPAPTGGTPTSVAEKSAIDIATAYAAAHAGHVVVVVLATDGLPSQCAPVDITGVSAIAAAGVTGGIKTFVIGVTSPSDPANTQSNLDALAAGGGSGKAFIVSTGGNVTAQFQAALDTIRGSALPCEYEIPPSEAGAPDYGKVNVQYTSGAGVKDILINKANAGACDAGGGWYYDVDPASGAPTKVILCPSTCDAVKKDTGSAKVDILLGCATIVK